MIKLTNILQEIELDSGLDELYEPFREYIRRGSEGDFNIRDHYTEEELKNITKVPNWFTKVGGDLHLFDSSITSLPDNLVVRGDLDLSYSPITSLPNNLKVGGSFYIDDPLALLYDLNTIRRMIEEKGGYVGGAVVR